MNNKWQILYFISIIAIYLLAFEYLLKSFGITSSMTLVGHFLINLPGGIVFGIADFLIINTTYNRIKFKNNVTRITLNFLLTNVFAALLTIAVNGVVVMFSPHDFDLLKVFLPAVIWNSFIVLLIEIFFYNQRQSEAEKKLANIEKEKIQYQYETLKNQINPHFLFNSLNVLSSLAYTDAEKTNLFAKKMSGVYRYLLFINNRPTVTLREELSFLESYVYLEQIRFDNALFVEIEKDDSILSREVIPVSLQLLVENAIKHNITTQDCPLIIHICLTNEGVSVSNNLQLRSSVDKGGVGLKNLQKQYALYDKDIEVIKTSTEFIVKIPYIRY